MSLLHAPTAALLRLEELPFPACLTDDAGRVLDLNSAWLTMDPAGHDEVAGATAIAPGDAARLVGLIICAGQQPDPIEIDIPNLGLVRWCRCSARRLDDGRVLLILVPIRTTPLTGPAAEVRAMMENAFAYISEGVVVLDHDLRVVLSTGFASNLLGRPGYANEGLSAFDQIHPADLPAAAALMATLFTRAGEKATIELRLATADGDWRWFEVIGINLFEHPAVGGILVLLRDIASRKEAEEFASRLVRLFDESPDLVLVLDRSTRPIYRNAALVQLLTTHFASPADARRAERSLIREVRRQLPAGVIEGSQPTWQGEIVVDLDSEVTLSLVLVIARQAGTTAFIGGIGRDISERIRLEAQLAHQAAHDSLTDLPNRATFLRELGSALVAQEHADTHLGVLFLDLDNLKDVNDSVGHHIGDALLIDVARRLRVAIRPFDVVARLGGDEFAVLCRHLPDEATAYDVAERVRRELTGRGNVERTDVFLSASIGFVTAAPGRRLETSAEADAMALLRDADTAMYRAKQLGRARVEAFTADLRNRAHLRRQLTADLEQAIAQHELFLEYQPIYSLVEERITSVETLLRWRHPGLGQLPPASFIDLAEESGLIEPIGRWVLDQAVAAMASLGPTGESIHVNVNVSARQLTAVEDFTETAAAVLANHRFPSHRLTLEITESTLLDDATAAVGHLDRLRALGIRTAIDDFGTGYSSLAYLRRFPMHELKLDGTFIRDLHLEPDSRAVVKAVIDLAHSLRMVVTAEAVAEEPQLAILRELGCDRVQGHLIGYPSDLATLRQILESNVIEVVAS